MATFERRLDGGPWVAYTGAFAVAEGTHTVAWRVRDTAGLERTGTTTVNVDTTAPTARATSSNPLVWSRLLRPTVQLQYTLGDNLSGHLRVGVVIHDVTGNVVRRLDGGLVSATPGATANRSVTSDGKNDALTGLVPLGVYYYRVVVTDEAGNVAHSGESKPVTIKL